VNEPAFWKVRARISFICCGISEAVVVVEGWYGDEYLVLFGESEIGPNGDRYGLLNQLPGFKLLGLRSWDDFIVRDSAGRTFTIPTVPFDQKYLEPFPMPIGESKLKSDPRFVGKVKWYLTPLVFGGDATMKDNCTWVSYEQHFDLVRFWNDKYRAAKSGQG
jgi:hypothetical protein